MIENTYEEKWYALSESKRKELRDAIAKYIHPSKVLIEGMGPDGYYSPFTDERGRGRLIDDGRGGKRRLRWGIFPWPEGCWEELMAVFGMEAA